MDRYKDSACEIKVPVDTFTEYWRSPRSLIDAASQVRDCKASPAFDAWWADFFDKIPIFGDDNNTKIGAWAGWCVACDAAKDLLR